jgi:hypothetical protein
MVPALALATLAVSLHAAPAVPAFVPAGELTYFSVEKPKLSGKPPLGAIGAFLAGVNYPWYNYGSDFGSNAWGHQGVSKPEVQAAVAADFDFLKSKGVNTVRWFLLCDGRAGLSFDQNGLVAGVNPLFYDDLDAALAIAQAHGIKLILSLFDFHMLDDAQMVGGVQTGGRANLISDVQAADSLFANALQPILKKYGGNSNILAWEVMNEPEMGIDGGLHPVGFDAMYAFARRVAAAVHAGGGQVTLGSDRRGHVAQWKGVGLDLYQYHYYDYMSWLYGEDLNVPYASLGLDKPCILGEFPTKGAKFSVDTYLGTMRGDGFAGAFAWSLRATDNYTDFRSVADGFAAWVNGR